MQISNPPSNGKEFSSDLTLTHFRVKQFETACKPVDVCVKIPSTFQVPDEKRDY